MTTKRNTLVSSKQRFWEVHVEKWSRSGLNQAACCRQNNLSIKGFGYWNRKLRKKTRTLELVQLVPEKIFVNPSMRLHVGSGYQIEIPDGFSRTTLKDVLSILRGL